MVNAGIRNVGMIMPNNYRSLVDHVGSGKDWDLDRKNGGLFIMPGTAFGTSRTGARFLIRDLVQNREFFTKNSEKYVVLSTANFISRPPTRTSPCCASVRPATATSTSSPSMLRTAA